MEIKFDDLELGTCLFYRFRWVQIEAIGPDWAVGRDDYGDILLILCNEEPFELYVKNEVEN